jgi:serine/threonine-protein kinase
MGIESVMELMEVIKQNQLLEREQLEELTRLRAGFPDSRVLAKHLIEKSWLTPYQVNQLFSKKGQDLVLGHYVLLERLGEGGMGAVFKARNRLMGRIVALKVIRREHTTNQDAVRRFRREIQLSSQLTHPNIVMTIDSDQVGDTWYMVMEYVESTDMGSLIKRLGPPPLEQACEYMRQAALGLQHAHEKGLIHRDIKPSNLLVTRGSDRSPWGPTVKILDMGVARLLQPVEGQDSISALTKEGRVVGTPDYMAPEQAANSAKADIRSDLYSLGCAFYQLVTGKTPYPGGTPMEKLLKHRVDPIPAPERLRPEVTPAVSAVVRRLMAKKPEERFQTPMELAQALEAIKLGVFPAAVLPPVAVAMPWSGLSDDSAPLAIPVGPGGAYRRAELPLKRWAWIAGAVGVLLLVLAIIGMILLSRGGRQSSELQPATGDPLVAQLKELTARVSDAGADRDALRRDLLQFRYEHAGSPLATDASRLLMRVPSPLDDLKRDAIPASERESLPDEVVAFHGESRQRHWGPARCVAVLPDGRLIASGGDDSAIRLWDPATMRERAVLTAHTGPVYWLGFLPDGQMLLSAGSDGYLRFWTNLFGKPQELPSLRMGFMSIASPTSVALSPDGHFLAAALPGNATVIRLWDIRKLPQRVAPQLRPLPLRDSARAGSAVAFAPDGTLASAGPDGQLLLWDLTADDPKPRALSKPAGGGSVLAFSATGDTLACGVERTICRWSVSKDAVQELPSLSGHNFEVRGLAFGPRGWLASCSADGTIRLWNGDGESGKALYVFKRSHSHAVNALAFAGTTPTLVSVGQDTTVRKWEVTDTAAREQPAPLKEVGGMVSALALNFDGQITAMSADGDANIHLWQPLKAKETTLRSGGNGPSALALAPDGQKVAAAGFGSDRVLFWPLASTEPGTPDELPSPGLRVTALAFAPDGKQLAAGCVDGAVRLCNLTASPRSWPVLGRHSDIVWSVAFSPDGKTVASGGDGTRGETKPVRLWNVETGSEIGALGGGAVAALAFSPDGKWLALAGADGTAPDLRLCDLRASPLRAHSLHAPKGGHTLPLTGVVFTPDGETIVTSGRDGQVVLHGPATGQVIRSWKLAGTIRAIALTADGHYLATGNGNGTVCILRMPRGGR